MLPCPYRGQHVTEDKTEGVEQDHHRRLLWNERRFLAAGGDAPRCKTVSVSCMTLIFLILNLCCMIDI